MVQWASTLTISINVNADWVHVYGSTDDVIVTCPLVLASCALVLASCAFPAPPSASPLLCSPLYCCTPSNHNSMSTRIHTHTCSPPHSSRFTCSSLIHTSSHYLHTCSHLHSLHTPHTSHKLILTFQTHILSTHTCSSQLFPFLRCSYNVSPTVCTHLLYCSIRIWDLLLLCANFVFAAFLIGRLVCTCSRLRKSFALFGILFFLVSPLSLSLRSSCLE